MIDCKAPLQNLDGSNCKHCLQNLDGSNCKHCLQNLDGFGKTSKLHLANKVYKFVAGCFYPPLKDKGKGEFLDKFNERKYYG